MVILDYSRCEGCKKLKSTKAITLNKILPEVLVDNIVSFDCCYYCGMKRAREVENKHNEHLSKIEKQIQYFQKTKMSVFNEGSIAKEMLQLKILIDKGNSPFSKVLNNFCWPEKSLIFSRMRFFLLVSNSSASASKSGAINTS